MRFVTDSGRVISAVTAEQMREIDRIAIEEMGPNLFQMMENAGRNLAVFAMESLGDAWRDARVAVLAGPGGNGGGGICAARHLANRGVAVRLCLSRPDRLSEVTDFQRRIFQAAGGREVEPKTLEKTQPTLILDALIGYGLKGPPRGRTRNLIQWGNGSGSPIFPLDVPSGLEATTGIAPGEAVRPTATLTLALPKTGLQPENSGKIYLSDIGIPAAVYRKAGIPYEAPFDRRFVIPLLI